MRKINLAVLHCSGSNNSEQMTYETIRWLHIAPSSTYFRWGNYDTYGKGWSDIAYHWVILQDGTRVKGRPESIEGSHCYGFNKNSLGICLVGNNNHTSEQFASLRNLMEDIKTRHKLDEMDFLLHNELSKNKTCPNFTRQDIHQLSSIGAEMENKNLIVEELKKEGLDLAEDTVVRIIRVMFKTIPIILANSSNPFVKGLSTIAVPVLSAVEKPLLGLVDKMDGEDDPEY
jgi:N-acetylmuramoyl-L-alanine amidase